MSARRRGPAPDFRAVPLAFPGERIGLFGGSFDPAHAGHLEVARAALKRLRLDRVWWLVTPQNPLKARAAGPLEERLASARRLARGARMRAVALESRLGTAYTADTLAALRRRRPGVNFVWIMGADGLARLHHWRDWRSILDTTPIAIAPRPGAPLRALAAPALARYRGARRGAGIVLMPMRLRPETSTRIREADAGSQSGRSHVSLTSNWT